MGSCEDPVGGGCGIENMSLNTGDAIDRTSLWAWNSLPPDARRMTSASGGFFHSVAIMRVADKYTGVKEGRPPHFHERLPQAGACGYRAQCFGCR